MPRMQILTPAEYTEFETPPVFTSVDRKGFFYLSQSVLEHLTTFRTPINQIGFVLTRGYFLATKRFFARQFHSADATYVSKQLGFLPSVFNLDTYDEATARRHRKIILSTWALGRLTLLPSSPFEKKSILWSVPKYAPR